MSFWKLLLLLILLAVVLVLGVAALCAVLGRPRGKSVQWARMGLTVSSGIVVITAVLVLSVSAIRALNHIRPLEASISDVMATPSASFDATGERVQEVVPYTTPEPGTIIRQTPEPERVTGVNYGADFALTSCNDYVYLMEGTSVYTGPGTIYDVIGSMTAGATVKRIGYNDSWSLIDYYNNYAFVPNDILMITE